MTSSMYRDFTRGASVEVDTILGDLLGRGGRHGLERRFSKRHSSAFRFISNASPRRTRITIEL
jgi:hypothetical protein